MYAVVGHAGEIAMGRRGSPRRVLTVLWLWRLAGTVPCTNKKSSGPAAAPAQMRRVQLPGSGATPLSYSFFLTDKAFRRAHRSGAGGGGFARPGGGVA